MLRFAHLRQADKNMRTQEKTHIKVRKEILAVVALSIALRRNGPCLSFGWCCSDRRRAIGKHSDKGNAAGPMGANPEGVPPSDTRGCISAKCTFLSLLAIYFIVDLLHRSVVVSMLLLFRFLILPLQTLSSIHVAMHWIFVSSPDSPNPQCDGNRKGGLWELIRSWGWSTYEWD